jgi:hypothetical protein
MKRKVPKILDLLSEELDLHGLKDSKALFDIYKEYLQGHFFLMSKGIKKYGEFEFFRDLFVYLKHYYHSDEYKACVYTDIMELYFKEQDMIRTYLMN